MSTGGPFGNLSGARNQRQATAGVRSRQARVPAPRRINDLRQGSWKVEQTVALPAIPRRIVRHNLLTGAVREDVVNRIMTAPLNRASTN